VARTEGGKWGNQSGLHLSAEKLWVGVTVDMERAAEGELNKMNPGYREWCRLEEFGNIGEFAGTGFIQLLKLLCHSVNSGCSKSKLPRPLPWLQISSYPN